MKNTLFTLTLLVLLCISVNAQTSAGDDPAGGQSAASTENRSGFRPTRTQIRRAQALLREKGTYSGDEDGRYNDEFRTALKTFQSASGLESSGRLDEPTLLKLGIELTDRQRGIERPSDKPKRTVFRPTREQITEAQKILAASGAYTGGETGRYNKELRSAIRDYQAANGLRRKGSLNRATLEKMEIELTEEQMAIPVNPNDLAAAGDGAPKRRGPVFRATKEQITEVQKMLREAGLYTGEETGKFNDDFRAAIKQWQEANGIATTGTLNKATLEAMRIELTDRQKEF